MAYANKTFFKILFRITGALCSQCSEDIVHKLVNKVRSVKIVYERLSMNL
jgi:hypothetical protein